MSDARRQNGWPTPPPPTTASHWFVPVAGTAVPPRPIHFVLHATLPPPAGSASLPGSPKVDGGGCTLNFDRGGTGAAVAEVLRAVKPSPYFAWPNVGYTVPYTSTLDCASARPGPANAPATAMVKSFFCMLTPLWFKPDGAAPMGAPRQPLSREVQGSVPNCIFGNQETGSAFRPKSL